MRREFHVRLQMRIWEALKRRSRPGASMNGAIERILIDHLGVEIATEGRSPWDWHTFEHLGKLFEVSPARLRKGANGEGYEWSHVETRRIAKGEVRPAGVSPKTIVVARLKPGSPARPLYEDDPLWVTIRSERGGMDEDARARARASIGMSSERMARALRMSADALEVARVALGGEV